MTEPIRKPSQDVQSPASAGSAAWTLMTEAMPALDEIVWLWEEGRGPWVGNRSDGGEGWLWTNCRGAFWWNGKKWDGDAEADDDYQPTHWMRLPEPPNSEPKLTADRPAGRSSAGGDCSGSPED
jgi:hypothetical protein